MKLTRIIYSLVLFFSLIFLPWWLGVFLLIIGLFYFKLFIEGVILALFFDIMFAIPTDYLFGFRFVMFLFSILLIMFFYFIKKRLFWTEGL